MPLSLIDLTLGSPEENLALDEALLLEFDERLRAGEGEGDGYLRLWESPRHFVVLGVSSRIAEDVDVDACRREDIPVLRRASGGGTVLQGPGCANFALVLPIAAAPALADLKSSYRYAIERSAAALAGPGGAMRGSSDLAIGDRKFGGSAQKRTARAILHHATVLHGLDLEAVARCLRPPRKQPDYRGGRDHRQFLVNLPLSRGDIRERLARAWEAMPVPPAWRPPELGALVAEKYGRPDWTKRF